MSSSSIASMLVVSMYREKHFSPLEDSSVDHRLSLHVEINAQSAPMSGGGSSLPVRKAGLLLLLYSGHMNESLPLKAKNDNLVDLLWKAHKSR
mmetsp:Transcript_38405/g.69228  ORF Transcript_38405/g.69228 Transcript_38405/m.69228 type:complete len:93 (+) Transcript_38405:105-383(+)